MSATVAAALKKIAVWILTDKKVMKMVGGIVLGFLIIIIMPLAAILGIFTGRVEVDMDHLHQMIQVEQSAYTQGWNEVESAMSNEGYSMQRIQEAEVLFSLVLYKYSDADGFTDKLTGCFATEQTDAGLINAVNSAFGTNIVADDFTKAMSGIRDAHIDTSEEAINDIEETEGTE